MAAINPPIVNFSGGIIGGELHNRVDIPTYPAGCEVMENFRPTLQGVMQRRPPMIHVDPFDDHDKTGELFGFSVSVDESYLVLGTETGFKFYANGGRLLVPAITATLPTAASGVFTDLADAATITASSTGGSGTIGGLTDEDGATFWQSTSGGAQWLKLDMGSAVTLRSLWFTALAAFGGYAPTAFTVSGSATGSFAGEETLVHTLAASDPYNGGERRKYRFTDPGSFRYYRIDMTANAVSSHYVIAELSVFSSGWLDLSESPGAVAHVGDTFVLDADGGNYAVLEAIAEIAEEATRHTIAFEIKHGPLDIRIGTESGGNDLMDHRRLRAGYHRLSFTPSNEGTVYIQFLHNANAGRVLSTDITFLSEGNFSLPCPFNADALGRVHTQQIRDVLYMTHEDYWPRRLERRGSASWSITKLLPDDGPFGDINTSSIELTPSATSGEITLTASEDWFSENDVGVLYEISGAGQTRAKTITAGDTWTDGIKVTGVGSPARSITYHISGTFTGTVYLQRSSGNENSYADVGGGVTAPGSFAYYDALDNQTWYYRIGVKSGGLTSGTVTVELLYSGGSSAGVVRVIEYNSATQVVAEVIEGKNLALSTATRSWKRGDWNADDGFPSAISDGFGRLWLARGDEVWASKSDDLTSFESIADEADSSFSRNIVSPSSDGVRWLAMLNHLIVGTGAIEKVGLGNTSSDPIGPSNFQFLPGSTEGGAGIQPISIGGSIIYVHRALRRVMQFTQNPKALSETSYISVDLTARAPEILDAKVVDVAVQSEPERRIYVVLESGKLCEMLFRREGELDVVAWSTVPTNGRVERVCVLPRRDEDVVHFIVRRKNAAGEWERHIEKFGPERPLMDTDRYHLDACLSYELENYDVTITPSGTEGTVTVNADSSVFVAGDVGRVLWLNGGRGTISGYAANDEITLTVTSPLLDADPCPPGRWGMRETTTTLTGLGHLAGRTDVRVYGDMMDLGTFTVSGGGEVTLPQAVSVAHAGLNVRSRWKSLKLSYGAQKGTALGMRKAIKSIILLLYKCGAQLSYGRAFSKMRPIPLRTPAVPMGEPMPLFTGESDHAFDAHYDPDSRIFLEVDGPAPATVSGFVPILDEKDR